MIFDYQALFSNAQAVTTGATASTNIMDLGAPGTVAGASSALVRNVSKGMPLPLRVQVTTTCTSGGSGTCAFAIQHSADASSWTTLYTTSAIAVATLVAGYEPIPMYFLIPGVTNRYVRILYTIATADFTAGNFTSGFTAGNQTNAD